jgi:hypothetical protein
MISKQVSTTVKAAPAVRLLGVGRSCSQAEHYRISQAPTLCTLPTMVDPTPIGALD